MLYLFLPIASLCFGSDLWISRKIFIIAALFGCSSKVNNCLDAHYGFLASGFTLLFSFLG